MASMAPWRLLTAKSSKFHLTLVVDDDTGIILEVDEDSLTAAPGLTGIPLHASESYRIMAKRCSTISDFDGLYIYIFIYIFIERENNENIFIEFNWAE